jgi:hypothetical protein
MPAAARPRCPFPIVAAGAKLPLRVQCGADPVGKETGCSHSLMLGWRGWLAMTAVPLAQRGKALRA